MLSKVMLTEKLSERFILWVLLVLPVFLLLIRRLKYGAICARYFSL